MPTLNYEKAAEIGYKAYSDSTNNKNFRDEEMLKWAELPAQQKAAWIAATDAITTHFNRFLIDASQEG